MTDPTRLGIEESDRRLSDPCGGLESVRPPAGADLAARRADGAAADDRVRATVSARRVESLRLDPRLLRQDSESLAAQIVAAVNAAFAALAAEPPDGAPEPEPEIDARPDRPDESVPSMAAFSQAMSDVLARMRAAGH
ncbi:MAG TPA: YbaB/EbfC family nucleoid-associated protein [Mycobacteriales bacterium]|nr:YbaB/EbfC family nucleoid-associated protein [Mycobacteriales bacterium]